MELQVLLKKGQTAAFNARTKLYQDWRNILAVVARPVDNRRGYFKKASNMNFCLRVARDITHLVTTENLSAKAARHRIIKDGQDGSHFIAGEHTLLSTCMTNSLS